MAKPVVKLLSAVTTTGAGSSSQLPSSVSAGQSAKATFQGVGSTSSGAGSATIIVQVSNDDTNWLTAGTITLTLSTTASSDGFVMDAPWAFVRGNVTAISGTGAAATLLMVI